MTLGFPKVSETQVAGEGEARAAIVAAVEAWPSHLSRELHDLVAQPLISLILEMNEYRTHGELDSAATQEMAKFEDSARTVLRNAREMLVDLRGQGEIRLNFREVLKNELIRRSAGKGAVKPSVQVSSTWPERINGWAAFNLLRIVQEAVTNATRHGRASRVEIILSTSPEEDAVLVVLDDGAGVGDAPFGIGIAGMQERAIILGGTLSVVSRLTGGTRVEVRIPLQRLQ